MYGESSAGCELIKLHDLLDGSMGEHVAYFLDMLRYVRVDKWKGN
jgi:hypothetical protein